MNNIQQQLASKRQELFLLLQKDKEDAIKHDKMMRKIIICIVVVNTIHLVLAIIS